MGISITHIDTACIILDINGYRIMTDPVLDSPGKRYHFGYGIFSKKTSKPALNIEQIGKIDLILLSHHQHKDNFDKKGKEFAKNVSRIITTKPGAKTMSNAVGLDNWENIKIETSKVPGLKITATPAQHHPWWLPEFFSGKVIGFILEWEGQKGAFYISGDTVYFKGIKEIAQRFEIDTGIIHMGSVQFRYLTGFGKYTFNVSSAIKAANVLGIQRFIPVHYSGWSHFKESGYEALDYLERNLRGIELITLGSGTEYELE